MDLHSATIRPVAAPGSNGNQLTIGPGTVRYVNSAGGGSTTSGGLTRESAFTTLDSAIDASSAGDTIILMEGHVEDKAASGAMFTADVAGLKIIGEGVGARRPNLTFSHTGATSTISAADVLIKNILFETLIDSVTTFSTISGADFICEDCELRDTTDIEVITDFTITGDRPTFRRLFKNGYTGGNANVRVLSLNGVDRALIEDCNFITKVTTAVIGFVTAASTAVVIRKNHFLVDSTTTFAKDVVDTIGGSTWSVTPDNYDLAAGASFSGGSGGALAGDDVGAVVALHAVPTVDGTADTNMRDVIGKKTDAAVETTGTTKSLVGMAKGALDLQLVPALDATANAVTSDVVGNKTDTAVYVPGTTKSQAAYAKGSADLQERVAKKAAAVMVTGGTLFTIAGGPIQVIGLVSICETGNDGTASTLQYNSTPTAGSATTFSGASASLANALAGATVTLAGTALATAALLSATGANLIANPGTIVVPAGTITSTIAVGSTTGTWAHYLRYKPLATGVTVS